MKKAITSSVDPSTTRPKVRIAIRIAIAVVVLVVLLAGIAAIMIYLSFSSAFRNFHS